MMTAKRKDRESETTHPTREEDTRADVWTPPGLLDAPPPRQGMRQRWVSTQILGDEIPHHTMRRFREGWTPRPANTIPENFPIPTIEHGKHEGCIGIEGMILCEMPEKRALAREAYFKGKTEDQSDYVRTQLGKVGRQGGIPIDQEIDRSFSRGSGRIAEDE